MIIADYDVKKGNEVLERLDRATGCPKKNIQFMHCDLRSLKSAREFVQVFEQEEERLDVLICNAGIA